MLGNALIGGVGAGVAQTKIDRNKTVYTTNLAVAAAFATIGFPVQMKIIQEVHNKSTGTDKWAFHIQRYADVQFEGVGSISTLDAQLLLNMLLDGRLEKDDPENPLLYALQGIMNYFTFRDAIDSQSKIFRISRDGTNRFALIKEGNEASFDKLMSYYKRSGPLSGSKRLI